MRFEVPQFIEIEDKIIGPLTWKQFVYLAGGAGLLIILYFTLPFIFFIMLGIPLGAFAASLAFHRINNRPFSIFLESFIYYFSNTKLYLWKKDHEQTVIVKDEPVAPPSNIDLPNRRTLSSLSKKLELRLPEK